jgi:hypothetical protein
MYTPWPLVPSGPIWAEPTDAPRKSSMVIMGRAECLLDCTGQRAVAVPLLPRIGPVDHSPHLIVLDRIRGVRTAGGELPAVSGDY